MKKELKDTIVSTFIKLKLSKICIIVAAIFIIVKESKGSITIPQDYIFLGMLLGAGLILEIVDIVKKVLTKKDTKEKKEDL